MTSTDTIVLPRSHPRFCAQHVRFVGAITGTARRHPTDFKIGDERFYLPRPGTRRSFEAGDKVFLMTRIPTFHGYAQQWAVHELVLPEAYWYYESWARSTPKEQRVHPYVPQAKTYFRGGTFVEKI